MFRLRQVARTSTQLGRQPPPPPSSLLRHQRNAWPRVVVASGGIAIADSLFWQQQVAWKSSGDSSWQRRRRELRVLDSDSDSDEEYHRDRKKKLDHRKKARYYESVRSQQEMAAPTMARMEHFKDGHDISPLRMTFLRKQNEAKDDDDEDDDDDEETELHSNRPKLNGNSPHFSTTRVDVVATPRTLPPPPQQQQQQDKEKNDTTIMSGGRLPSLIPPLSSSDVASPSSQKEQSFRQRVYGERQRHLKQLQNDTTMMSAGRLPSLIPPVSSSSSDDAPSSRQKWLSFRHGERQRHLKQQQQAAEPEQRHLRPLRTLEELYQLHYASITAQTKEQEKDREETKEQEKDREETALTHDSRHDSFSATITTTVTIPKRRVVKDNQPSVVVKPKQEEEEDTTVLLPTGGSITLLQLSQRLRVKVETLVETLHAIGEEAPWLPPPNHRRRRRRRRRRDGEKVSRQDVAWRHALKKERNEKLNDDNDDDNFEPPQDFVVSVPVAELICLELGREPVRQEEKEEWNQMEQVEQAIFRRTVANHRRQDHNHNLAVPRPPVICIMGHVDHGKTTLMDALRQAAAQRMTHGTRGDKNKTRTTVSKKKGKKSKQQPQQEQEVLVNGFTNVAGTEAGGITQVISAFEVLVGLDDDDNSDDHGVSTVTFLDTPGHAAFGGMRQSGFHGADVICLVIAADDGVSAQTLEILEMYQAMKREAPDQVSLVIAMTKIDKPHVEIAAARDELERQLLHLAHFDVAEENCPICALSAMTGEGLDDFLQEVLFQAQVMDLQSVVETPVQGIVMDAQIRPGLGVVVDAIVRAGTIAKGNVVLSGTHIGKVRVLHSVNEKENTPWQKAGPSQPVRIIGFKGLPKAGDSLIGVESEEVAKEIVQRRLAVEADSDQNVRHAGQDAELQVMGVEAKEVSMLHRLKENYGLDNDDDDSACAKGTVRIPVVVKADAKGSLEAVRDALLALAEESKLDFVVDIVEKDIGPVNPSDIRMAQASGAPIFCFGGGSNSLVGSWMAGLAEDAQVTVRQHKVIYHLLEDAKQVFAKYFPLQPVDIIHGEATVKAVFEVNNKRHRQVIAGLQVTDGHFYLDKTTCPETGVTLPCFFRVLRQDPEPKDDSDSDSDNDNDQPSPTAPTNLKAKSLRRVKEEVTMVRRGEECGLGLESHDDYEEGDVIQCFSTRMEIVQL